MSNIFDILHRGKGDIADLVRPLVAPQDAPQLRVSAEAKAKETKSGGGSSLAEAQSARESMPDNAPDLAAFQTLNLRISAPSPLLPFEDSQWRPSEQYRILRTKINQHPKQPRLIVVSSPAPGDGKSVTAINTAAALSLKKEGGVLLLDADLRKSAIHVQLGLPESPGLADVLKGACALEDAIAHVHEFPNLYVMTAGKAPGNPTELLDSGAWQGLCAKLRSMFRYVVLDSPPVGAVADYDLIQAVCDGVILVIRPDHTNRQLCQKSLEHLPKEKFLGVLLNCVPDWSPGKGAGTDYYYYSDNKPYPNRNAAG